MAEIDHFICFRVYFGSHRHIQYHRPGLLFIFSFLQIETLDKLFGNAIFIDEQVPDETDLVTLHQNNLAFFGW